jgi:FkbM family methyltransferase
LNLPLDIRRVINALAWRWHRLRDYRWFHLDDVLAYRDQRVMRKLFTTTGVDCVFDVGANRGDFTAYLRTKIGYDGLIVCFEPIPELVEHLSKRFAKDPAVRIEPYALDRTPGTKKFNVMKNDTFSSLGEPCYDESSRYDEPNTPIRVLNVQVETLDRCFQRLEETYRFRSPFLKLDTQGFDLAVVEGGEQVIDRFVGLRTEAAIKRLYEEAVPLVQVLPFFQNLGFTLADMNGCNRDITLELAELDLTLIRNDFLTKE